MQNREQKAPYPSRHAIPTVPTGYVTPTFGSDALSPPFLLSGAICLPRMATASLWRCSDHSRKCQTGEEDRRGQEMWKPGASASGGAEQRGTGCSTGSYPAQGHSSTQNVCQDPRGDIRFSNPPEWLRQHTKRKAGKERRAQPELSSSPQRGQVLTFIGAVDAGAWARLNHNHFLQ